MSVDRESKEYELNKARWRLMRAIVGGEDFLKGVVGGFYAKDFLPEFTDKNDSTRYDKYVKRAVFYNYTGWTVAGMIGSVFRKDTSLDVPDSIEYVNENMDGEGLELDGFAKYVLSEVLTVGRVGCLVDVEDRIARCTTYCAESILGYEVGRREGQKILTLVRLKEVIFKRGNSMYEQVEELQYRVVALDDAGWCYHRVYDKDLNQVGEDIHVKRANGTKIDFIPFVFVGADNNKPEADKPPLLDIGNINLGHFRNSADYEENMFIHGQATLILDTGMVNNSQIQEAYPGGIKVGSRSALAGPGFKGELLQAQPSDALRLAMQDKVEQMIGLGARFVQKHSGNQVVDAVLMDKAQKEGGLTTIVGNIEWAMWKCLDWMADIMGSDGQDIVFVMNRDFYDQTMTAQEASALIMMGDSGHMAPADINAKLKRVGWVESARTVEEIQAESEVSGGGLDGGVGGGFQLN